MRPQPPHGAAAEATRVSALDTLSQRGRDAAESLEKVMNSIFTALLRGQGQHLAGGGACSLHLEPERYW